MGLQGGLLVAMPHGISVAGTPICAAVTVVGTVHVVTPAVAATVPEEKYSGPIPNNSIIPMGNFIEVLLDGIKKDQFPRP